MIRYYLTRSAGDFALTFERKTAGASGFDLHANEQSKMTIRPGCRELVRTGLHVQMPPGIEAQVRPRSGLARDCGVVAVLGTIDSDYRGEIKVLLINFSTEVYTVHPGQRIAQLVFAPVMPMLARWRTDWDPVRADTAEELGQTERGNSGFGSTG